MIRSFFTATSGVITENRNLTVRSNNLANANTAGFKKDTPINSTFADMLLTRVGENDRAGIGAGAFMNVVQTPYTDYSQGSYEDTERPFDFAIQGDGYFSVMGDNDQIYLTRDGTFYLDEDVYKRQGWKRLSRNLCCLRQNQMIWACFLSCPTQACLRIQWI